MIEELQQLEIDTMITIDDEASHDFTGHEDFVVDEVTTYNCDDTEIVLVSLGDYILIASNVSGETKYAICENYSDADDYMDEKDFLEEIEVSGGEDIDEYQKVESVSSCDDDDDTCFCEYTSSCHFDYVLIHFDGDGSTLYRGIEISEDQIIL